jgi:cytochrome P450
MTAGYDPWDPSVHRDPYPAYRWLRREAPRYRHEDLGFTVLSRHRDVTAALRDPARLSSADGVGLVPQEGLVLVGEDPPEHTRRRRLASRAFTRPALARHAEAVEAVISRLVDAALERGTVDVVSEIGDPLTLEVLTGVLGIPLEEPDAMLAQTRAIFAAISARTAGDLPTDLAVLNLDVGSRVDACIEARKRAGTPGQGDLVDAVVAHAEPDADGWRLDRLARATFVTALIAPGLDTTRNLVANALHALAQHPDQWRRFREGEVGGADVVEEALRYDAPVQGFFRSALEPVEVAGGVLPPGTRVLLLFGSANRDESVFEDPDRFDVARRPTEHLAFGSGIHFCVGAGLARLEGAALLEALRARVARLEPAGEGTRLPDALLRGWTDLPLTFVPA